MVYFTLVSAISKVDSKGRVSIPIGLRARLGLVEGSNVKIVLEKNRLIVSPDSGQSGVKVARKSVKLQDRVRFSALTQKKGERDFTSLSGLVYRGIYDINVEDSNPMGAFKSGCPQGPQLYTPWKGEYMTLLYDGNNGGATIRIGASSPETKTDTKNLEQKTLFIDEVRIALLGQAKRIQEQITALQWWKK